jgi:hypothetical protein
MAAVGAVFGVLILVVVTVKIGRGEPWAKSARA